MGSAPKPPTLADVARLADVSVPTASRALNGGIRGAGSGSAVLRQRVIDAARDLGYSVNAAAQATKGGRSNSVALVVSDIDDFGSASMISGVMHAAEERGVSVAVRTTRHDPLRERELLAQLRGERHRAVIIATGRTTDQGREDALSEELEILDSQGTRVVVIGDSSLRFPAVTVDNHDAARLLADGLVGLGFRRFAILSAHETEITARDRLDGFLAGLSRHGISVADRDIIHAAFSRDGGYAAVDALATRLDEFDVLSAMSDAMAVGAIARLRELDVELEVTGFDHVPMLRDVLADFTTVEVPLGVLGEAALSLCLDGEPPPPTARIALKAVPIVRGRRYRPVTA